MSLTGRAARWSLAIGVLVWTSSLASAQAPQSVQLRDVAIETRNGSFRAATVDIQRSSLGQAELAALTSRTDPVAVAAALRRLDAAAISIPEARITRSNPKQSFTLRKLEFRDVAKGVAGTLLIDGGSASDGPINGGGFGRIGGRDLDLATLTEWATAPGGPAAPPLAPAKFWTSLGIEAVDFAIENGGKVAIARLLSTNLRRGAGTPQDGVPLLGSVAVQDVTVLPGRRPAGQGGAPGPAESFSSLTVKLLSLSSDQAGPATPARLAFVLDSLGLVPASTSEGLGKGLAELGYSALLMSARFDAALNAATGELTLTEARLAGEQIGSVTLGGVVGGVGAPLLSGSRDAWNAVTFKSLGIVFENTGLFEHIVVKEARRTGKSLEETKAILVASLGLTVNAMTAGLPQGNVIVAAVSRFAAKPGRLQIGVTVKDGKSLPLSTFSDRAAAAQLKDRIDVTAVAD